MTQKITEAAELILKKFQPLLDADDVSKIGRSIPIPTFSKLLLHQVIGSAIEVLKREPTLLDLHGNFVVVGDIHGSLHDLIRILAFTKLPPLTSFLFLGDYVDRGSYSTEVLAILLSLLILYPSNVFLIRGNHEDSKINAQYGFLNEIRTIYLLDDLWIQFNSLFTFLPLAAIINETFFCVHGGISPNFYSLKALKEIQRPIIQLNHFITDILWSDPSSSEELYCESLRGFGYNFGSLAVHEFLEKTNLKFIIRGHQCITDGIFIHFKSVFTIFSSSNYDEKSNNRSGILRIKTDNTFDTLSFSALAKLKRTEAKFDQPLLIDQNITQNCSQPVHSFSFPSCSTLQNQQKPTKSLYLAPNRNITKKRKTLSLKFFSPNFFIPQIHA